MANWVFYNALLPLLPVPFAWLATWLVGASRKLTAIIRDGQLCFYSTSLCAVALRDLLNLPDPSRTAWFDLYVAGVILCLVPSTFIYGVAMITLDARARTESAEVVAVTDARIALASLTASLFTLVLILAVRADLGLWS